MQRDDLIAYLNESLQPQLFRDYAPNGLQVEGCQEIKTLVAGVTANRFLIEEAIALKADAILVHHGLFWKGDKQTITGLSKQRLAPLLKHDINLMAYHLPLDAHPVIGNNAQLAKQLNFEVDAYIDIDNNPGLFAIGHLTSAMPADDFTKHLQTSLNREPMHFSGASQKIHRVAWCTGGAQSYLPLAIENGVDAYITGEYSLPMVELAKETGIHFYAAGHHATERGGVKALMAEIGKKFKLNVHFIDIDNPA